MVHVIYAADIYSLLLGAVITLGTADRLIACDRNRVTASAASHAVL